MPVRMQITKQTTNGEHCVVDVCQWNPVTGEIMHDSVGELCSLADEGFKLADTRALEMHVRMLEAYQLQQYCSPAEWSRIVSLLDIISGRDTASNVARRWQSEQEETAELEQARLEQALAHLNGDSDD